MCLYELKYIALQVDEVDVTILFLELIILTTITTLLIM